MLLKRVLSKSASTLLVDRQEVRVTWHVAEKTHAGSRKPSNAKVRNAINGSGHQVDES